MLLTCSVGLAILEAYVYNDLSQPDQNCKTLYLNRVNIIDIDRPGQVKTLEDIELQESLDDKA